MKKNLNLKVLTGTVVGVATLILMNNHHQSVAPQESHTEINNLNEAIASQFNDNIRDVAARLQETQKHLAQLEAESKAQHTQDEQEKSMEQQFSTADLVKEIEHLKAEIANLKSLKAPHQESKLYAIDGQTGTFHLKKSTIQDVDRILMKQEQNPNETAYWEKFHLNQNDTQEKSKLQLQKSHKEKSLPFYTIPAGSDLGKTTLLSALIGEVPVEGKLMQPLFPFSAVINRGDLMAANGIPLPSEIAGMKINGYAIGVGSFLDNISCVRAYVTSALFVFEDGHFVTVGKEQMNGSAEMINNESLGYLTTSFGNPCIKGQYFTNAPRVLTTLLASDSVKGIGEALSKWQMSYTENANGTTSTPTGSMQNYALGGALSQGTAKASDWLEKRIQGSFDMVFVPASIPYKSGYKPNQFSFHLTQTINLDKASDGRLLDYGHIEKTTYDFNLW